MLGLSPFQIAVVALHNYLDDFRARLKRARSRFRLLLTPEILDLVPALDELPANRVVRVAPA